MSATQYKRIVLNYGKKNWLASGSGYVRASLNIEASCVRDTVGRTQEIQKTQFQSQKAGLSVYFAIMENILALLIGLEFESWSIKVALATDANKGRGRCSVSHFLFHLFTWQVFTE